MKNCYVFKNQMMMFKFNFTQIRITFLIAFLVLESSTVVYSQQNRTLQPNSDNWEIGLNMGLVGFSSEESTPNFKNCKLGYGVSLSKQVSPLFGFKGHLLVGGLIGESPDYTFNFNLIETVINATLNISNLCWGPDRNQLINVYGLVGLGFSNFYGYTVNINNGQIQQYGRPGEGIFGYRGYRTASIGNFGLYISIDLRNNLKATVESAFKIMNDRIIDGNAMQSDYDSYNYTSIGIAYKIPFSKKHQWYCR